MKKFILTAAAITAFSAGLLTSPARSQDTPKRPRFDHIVRNDFFAGFTGDQEAFQRAMKVSEETLAENPKHAEALVWHGAGLMFQSGQLFRAGDQQKGMEAWGKGMGQMDMAVALAPDSVGIRIPRGASLLTMSRFVPEAQRPALLQRAVDDYSRVYDMQKDSLDKIGTHPRGELLMGLADGLDRSGQHEKALSILRQVTSDMGGTVYAKRAQQWLDKGDLEPMQRNCIGCHTPAQK